ncbi:hypothetical protein QBC46DRAFT_348082 [Diplogelasinospora grovesii]|uniref:Uncharacterized protein n=1 Tax=Diplogelasinospora grovesii TaxID=303347 RepID=A0AAN6MW80_9PEZI|nr:hypothetical protein QBC46DRAFT_348082 [Diplogelasinospora grovesii]
MVETRSSSRARAASTERSASTTQRPRAASQIQKRGRNLARDRETAAKKKRLEALRKAFDGKDEDAKAEIKNLEEEIDAMMLDELDVIQEGEEAGNHDEGERDGSPSNHDEGERGGNTVVKKEQEAEGLFVAVQDPSDHKPSTSQDQAIPTVADKIVPPAARVDPDDIITFQQAKESEGEYQEQLHYYVKGPFKQKLGLFQYGPPNACIFRLKPVRHIDESIKWADQLSLGEEKENGEWSIPKGAIKAIQGVALYTPKQYQSKGPTWLLDPENWPLKKAKDDGRPLSRYAPGSVRIKVRIEVKGVMIKTWETRKSVRRIWGDKDSADEAILLAATYCEKRYKEWSEGQRQAKDASPTPDPEFEKLLQQQDEQQHEQDASQDKGEGNKA